MEILDIEKLIPEKRMLRIPEKQIFNKFQTVFYQLFPKLKPKLIVREIDVSQTSARVTFKLLQQVGKFAKLAQEEEDEQALEELLELLVLMFKPSFPEVTADWIKDQMTLEQIVGAFQFCIEPLVEQTVKNPQAAQFLKSKLGR